MHFTFFYYPKFPIRSRPSFSVAVLSAGHSANAPARISLRDVGASKRSSPVPRKTFSASTRSWASGANATCFRLAQPEKAPLPISVTHPGTSSCSSAVPWKQRSPMVSRSSGSRTRLSLLPLNVSAPRRRSVDGSETRTNSLL